MLVRSKPENISWEELANCQQRAHESNKVFGVNMQCAGYTADDLRVAVKDGDTLVALDESGTLMGMLSINYRKVNRWWHKGEAAYICYVAVAPEYKGRGVYRALSRKAEDYIIARGLYVWYLNTHIANKTARRVYERDGYRSVRFSPGTGTDYYSVEMAKWPNRHGKNKYLCKLMYITSEIIIRMLFKPGKIRRF